VRERGEGPVVTLLHGFPMSSFDWARLEPLLARDRRVVSLDLLGYGASDAPAGHRYGTAEHADVVEAVWRALGVTSTVLVGHDVGTGVARELLARRADGDPNARLDGVLLLNGALVRDHYTPKRTVRLLALPVVGPLLARAMDEDRFVASLAGLFPAATRPPAAELREHWTAFAGHAGTARLPRLVHYLADGRANEQRWLAALQRPGVPVSVVWGADDPAIPRAVADDVARRLPHVRLTLLEGTGHSPHVEHPEVVAAAVRALVTT
jgi:pimeloyl-ACP methyl ester carboxylesterase